MKVHATIVQDSASSRIATTPGHVETTDEMGRRWYTDGRLP
jgi:hypothetical protein